VQIVVDQIRIVKKKNALVVTVDFGTVDEKTVPRKRKKQLTRTLVTLRDELLERKSNVLRSWCDTFTIRHDLNVIGWYTRTNKHRF
jgi:hypothetical protein